MNVGGSVNTLTVSSSPALSVAFLAPLAQEAWQLEPPAPHEVPHVLRHEAALQIDSLLSRVSRGSGALEVAMGEALDALGIGDRVLRLGYSGIGDYARERMGIAGRTAQTMARLARELRDRPLLRAAVQRGEVSPRKAEAVLLLARGETEEQWVARARVETVRELQAAAHTAVARGETEEDREWERICIPLAPEGQAKLDQAMDLAGKLLGATAPKWQRLEAICQEYLGAHPIAEPVTNSSEVAVASGDWNVWGAGVESFRSLLGDDRTNACPLSETLEQILETETQRWAWLTAIQPVEAPGHDGDRDPFQLDEELRELVSMRERWDELVGHLGLLLRMLGLWRELGFASFAHYCRERLGMSPRTVEQRVWLERRLHEIPALRLAMRQGRLSYEKARLVAGCAGDTTVNDWIERAEKVTCIALKREIESSEQKQICARGELDQRVPKRVASLLDATFRAAREIEGRWLSPGECLVRVAEHFISVWNEALCERRTPQKRVLERDRGWVRVRGCAPDGLFWELGVRPALAHI